MPCSIQLLQWSHRSDAKTPRLLRRGATYSHRAVAPQGLKATYPKTEETIALRATDHREALRRVRIAAVEVDRRFEAHRRMLAESGTRPPLKALAESDIKRVSDAYFANLREKDEETRLQGLADDDNEPGAKISTTDDPDQINQLVEYRSRSARRSRIRKRLPACPLDAMKHDYARGRVDAFIASEAEDVLNWDNINIRLEPSSPSWPRLARALQAATIKAYEVIQRRNEGEVVETPKTKGLARESRTRLLSSAVEEWIEEKSRVSWGPKTGIKHESGWITSYP